MWCVNPKEGLRVAILLRQVPSLREKWHFSNLTPATIQLHEIMIQADSIFETDTRLVQAKV